MASFNRRRVLGDKKNALMALPEDAEAQSPVVVKPATPKRAPSVTSPVKPTATDIADADAALARMEAELAAKQKMPPPPPPPGAPGDDDDDDSSSSEEDEAAARTRKSTSWRKSVGRRDSSSRRSSLDHVTPAQRMALRRLSNILRDNGAGRRAREAEESAELRATQAEKEVERKRLSMRRRRLRSIAKLMDLSLVWEWLETEDGGAPAGDDADEPLDVAAAEDDAALRVVQELAEQVAERQGGSLRLTVAEPTPTREGRAARTRACRAIRDLRSLAALAARVASYDESRGFYQIRVALPLPGAGSQVVVVERSWRDLLTLTRGLTARLAPGHAKLLPKLPKPRPLSELKRGLRNLTMKNRKGDRKWQKTKTPKVDAWLNTVLALVVKASAQADARRDGAARRDADEYLEDFLFKFGRVVEAAP